MEYTEVLDSFGSIIENNLKRQFEHLARESEEYHPFMAKVYRAMSQFVMRSGRRLSSSSTMMVYKGYTNQVDEGIVNACAAIELFRHSILVHDDIVDAESLRRGGQTLHRILEKDYDARFGVSSSIFIGNMLYSLAIKSILKSGFKAHKLADVISLITSDFKDVNESQILDLLFEYKEPDVKEWEIMAGKRAASLFRTAMLTGAKLAGAPKRDCSILEEAAMHIGFAFDIQDDIIDTFASKEQYGRDPCGDISKKKKPLHFILALEREGTLASIMGDSQELTEESIKNIKELIRDCGALKEAKSISRDHAKEAERLIAMTTMNGEAKEFFISIIRFIDESLDWYR